MGFNASACVYETVQHAIETTEPDENGNEISTTPKFKVALLRDTIGEDGGHHAEIGFNLMALVKEGAVITDTEAALEYLR